MSGKTVELTAPSGSDDTDVTVTYSANAVNVTDYVIVEAHADGAERLHGLPTIYAAYCGAAYVRTPHEYEETLDETRNFGDTTLDKLPHIMYDSGRCAEFSFYFLD